MDQVDCSTTQKVTFLRIPENVCFPSILLYTFNDILCHDCCANNAFIIDENIDYYLCINHSRCEYYFNCYKC